MSNTRRLRGYGQKARAAYPGYVTPDATCDVPRCGAQVGGSRTFTFIRQDKPPLSVLVRLCTLHTDTPREQLLPLLPVLDGMVKAAGNVPFADLGES